MVPKDVDRAVLWYFYRVFRILHGRAADEAS
jgi:hypothetical protein